MKAAAWAADAEATTMLEPHARRAAEAMFDDAAQQEIVWLADPGAEPPDLTIRRAAPALRALVADIEAAIQRSVRRS